MSSAERPHHFWVPTVMSAIALTVSALEFFDSRRARTVSATPLVDFFTQDDENEHALGVSVRNNGPGVAQVGTVHYYVDHKPVPALTDALAASDVKPSSQHIFEWESGDSLAVGESVWLFQFQFRAKDRQAAAKFSDFLDDHLGVEIDYCSVGGEHCSSRCSTEGLCKLQQPGTPP